MSYGYECADYGWEKNEDGSYKVINNFVWSEGKPRVEIKSLIAEDLIKLPEGALLAKHNEQYTMYATSLIDITHYNARLYGDLHKFLDGILEYFSFGNVFLYRTIEGWFFLFYDSAFWKIGNKDVLKRRVEGLTKLCEPDTQILECKVLKLCPYEVHTTTHYLYSNEVKESCETRYKYFGYMVKTSKGSFLLYKGNGCIYDVIPTYFIQMNRYSKVPGYENLARIHPNKGRKFFLANLSYDHIRKTYAEDLIQKITYLGDGYLLAQNGSKSKLLFCYDSFLPDTVVDWGVHSFTKVDSWKEDDYIVYTAWRVDDGESSYSIIHKYRDVAYLSIPKLKEKKKD